MQQLPLPEKIFYFGLFPLFLLLLITKVTALQSAPVQRAVQAASTHQNALQAKAKAKPLQLSYLWAEIPYCVSFGMLALLLLWRSRRRRMAYFTATGFLFLAMSELIPLGTHGIITSTYSRPDFALCLLGSLSLGLIMYFLLHTPEELPSEKRLSKRWAYAVVFVDAISRTLFYTKAQTTSVQASGWIWVGDTLVALAFTFVLVYNYIASPALGKRRSRWVIYASLASQSPWLLGSICSWLIPSYSRMVPWEVMASFALLLIPIGFVVSLLSDDLMQVDGPTKVGIVFVSSVLLVAASIQLSIPWFAQYFETQFTMNAQASRFILSLLSIFGLALMALRLYPRTLHYFLPEQKFVTEGLSQLQANINTNETPVEMLSLLGQTLDTLLYPERWLAFRRQGEEWVLLFDSMPSHTMPVHSAQQDVLSHPSGQRVALHMYSFALSHPTKVTTLFLQPKRGWEGAIWVGPKRSRTPYNEQEILTFQAMIKLTEDTMHTHLQQKATEEQLKWMANLQESHAVVLSEQKEQASQFAGLNHDLKQPLETIRLLSEMLEERPLDQQSQSLLADLHNSAISLRSMLHESLDQAKQRALSATSTNMRFQLAYLEERLHSLFAAQATQKGLDFALDFQDHEVYSDPQLLERILLNLLSNAIRYTERGHVKGSARNIGPHIVICIEDTGQGFEQGTFEKASQEWSQLELDAAEGHGLGLAITAQLVDHLKIELDVESAPGKGSLFRLSLPKPPPPE